MKYTVFNKTTELSLISADTSPIFNLANCDSLGIITMAEVVTPSAAEFDSPAYATGSFQGVVLTAQAIGTGGNSITYELLVTGVPSEPLDIVVGGNDISVTLENDAGVASSLVDQSLTYTANTVGTAGDDISITLTDPAGNDESLAVDVVGTDIEVTLATDGTGGITSTGNDVKLALNTDIDSSALITVTGSNASALTALGSTNLASGAEPAVVTDADALIIALNADGSAFALVEATGSGSSPLTAETQDNLTGGQNDGVNVDDNEVTITSHGFTTGLIGQLTTNGTLPAGLSTGTNYYIITVDDDIVKFATSLANAQGGTAVNITTEGVGIGTFTPTAISGGSAQLQVANDVNGPWINSGTSTSIGSTMNFGISLDRPAYNLARVQIGLTAGQLDLSLQTLIKSDNPNAIANNSTQTS